MTPEYKPGSPEEMESRITALLLGELPEAEAAEVRAAVKRDPELARLCQRLKATIELVRQAAAPAEPTAAQATPLKLSEARRQQLLQRFKTIAPREFAAKKKETSWSILIPLAALLMFLFAVSFFLPALSKAKNRSQMASAKYNLEVNSPSAAVSEESLAFVPQAQSISRADSGGLAPTERAIRSQTWNMQPGDSAAKVENAVRRGRGLSLPSGGKPAKPSEPPAGVALGVEPREVDKLSRGLSEPAHRVELLTKSEELRQKVTDGATASGRVKIELPALKAPETTPPGISAGQLAVMPSTPSVVPPASGPLSGGFGAGGMGGGGGFGGGGGGAGGGAAGVQGGAWYGETKQEAPVMSVSEAEMFSRRYGIRPQGQRAPAGTPAPPVAGPAGALATQPADAKRAYAVTPASPAPIPPPEFVGTLSSPANEGKLITGTTREDLSELRQLSRAGTAATDTASKPAPESSVTLGATLRGFYDDNRIANGDLGGVAAKGQAALEKGVPLSNNTWADYDNDGFLDLFAANGKVAGNSAGVAGAAPAENKPADTTLFARFSERGDANTLFRNSGSGTVERMPILGDTPMAGRMFRSQNQNGAEALGRRAGETAAVQEDYYC